MTQFHTISVFRECWTLLIVAVIFFSIPVSIARQHFFMENVHKKDKRAENQPAQSYFSIQFKLYQKTIQTSPSVVT